MPYDSDEILVDLLIKDTNANRLTFFKVLFSRVFSVVDIFTDIDTYTQQGKTYNINRVLAKVDMVTQLGQLRDYLSVRAPEGKVLTEQDRQVMAMYKDIPIENRLQKRFIDLVTAQLKGRYSLGESPIEQQYKKDRDLLLAVHILIHTYATIIYSNGQETSSQVAKLNQYKAAIETSRVTENRIDDEFIIIYNELQKTIEDPRVKKDVKELAVIVLEKEIECHAPWNKAGSFLVDINEQLEARFWKTKGLSFTFWTFEKIPNGIVELRKILLPLAEKLSEGKIKELRLEEVQPIFEQILIKLRSKVQSVSWTRKAETAAFYKQSYEQAQSIYNMEFGGAELSSRLGMVG